MSSNDIEQFKALFIEECDEQLQVMEDELLQIEQQGASPDSVQRLFRAAHTIKGSSAAMGYARIKQLTHEMEQVLDGVRNSSLSVTPDLVEALFQSLDGLTTLKTEISDGNEESLDIDLLVQGLQQCTQQNGSGDGEFKVSVSIQPSSEMKMARALVIYNKLQQSGEVISTNPSLEEEHEDGAYQEVVFQIRSDKKPEQVERFVRSLMDVENVSVAAWAEDAGTEDAGIQHKSEKPSSEAASPKDSSPSQSDSSSDKGKSKTQPTIRVNVERLDYLMNLVGELVIDQTRIQQVKGNLEKKYEDEDVEELGHVGDHITRIIADLQDSVMKVRMLPIDQLFQRFPRMVRDLSQSLHKEIELVLEGNETELDRTLIEEIGDPIIHLVRNAIDHGIEDAETRLRNGKPAKGRVRIAAAHEDNQVAITVEDDGAGIDADAIKASAVRKGVITEEEAERLTDQEAVHLIFHAGFSTAAQVSEISGRGVGMDIVRSDIERLNGLIDIDTTKGQGTIFKIKLPLTLAIITGLNVSISNQTFILPMGNVAEIIRVPREEIQQMRGKEVVVNRNRVIPVQWLHDSFGLKRLEQSQGKQPIVIVGTAEKRVALAVDHLIGNQDIVIKSIGSFVGKTDCVSGATILGDGKVALILDVSDILKQDKGA